MSTRGMTTRLATDGATLLSVPMAFGLFLPAAIAFVFSLQTEVQAADAPMRYPISPTHPLFTFITYTSTPAAIESLYNVIPADIKPYAAIVFGGWPSSQGVHALASRADQLGVWLFWYIASQDQHPTYTVGFLDSLFVQHPKFLGLGYVETSLAVYCGQHTYPWPQIRRELSIAAKNGGYIYWVDGSFEEFCDTKDAQIWTTFPADVIDSLRLHKSNLIMHNKHNSYGGTYSTCLGGQFGLWAMDLAGAWGFHTEDWDWQSNSVPGFGKFGSDACPKDSPLGGFGIDITTVIPFGCCVYGGENAGNVYPYFSGINSGWDWQILKTAHSPAWEMVIYPLYQRIIRDTLIPTREEVLARTKVAFHASVANAPQLASDAMYKGLYSSTNGWNWWPQSGRYGMIPVLPPVVTESEFAKFPEVVHTNSLPWTTQAEKVAWFNARYAAEPGSSGNAFFYNVRNRWFITCTDPSGSTNATFKFDLKGNSSLALGGDFSGVPGDFNTTFAYAIVKEHNGTLNIYVNNYLLDANQSLSSENSLIRKSVFRISGLSSEPTISPLTAIKGYHDNNNFSSSSAWDASAKVFTITLNHNGSVDLTVNHPDFKGPEVSTNAAKTRKAMPVFGESSRVRLVTIDGRVVMSEPIASCQASARGIIRSSERMGTGVYVIVGDRNVPATPQKRFGSRVVVQDVVTTR